MNDCRIETTLRHGRNVRIDTWIAERPRRAGLHKRPEMLTRGAYATPLAAGAVTKENGEKPPAVCYNRRSEDPRDDSSHFLW